MGGQIGVPGQAGPGVGEQIEVEVITAPPPPPPTADTGLFWGAGTEAEWLSWPGRIDAATRQVYEFRLRTAPGVTSIVSALSALLDVPDVRELFNDIAIAAAGTRLSITKSYRAIKNVTLALQNDGGTAVTAKIEDKGTGGPPLTAGPLVKTYTSGGVATTGLIDAEIVGY